MNILILSPHLPYPLNSGGAQGVFNMVDQLRHKHHYTILISKGREYDPNNIKKLKQLWPEVDVIYYPLWRQMTYPPFVYERARRVLLKKLAPGSRRLELELATRPYGEWFSHHHVNYVAKLIKDLKIDMVQVEFYECLPWSNYLPSTVKKIFIHHELGFVRKQRQLQGLVLTEKEKRLLEKSKQTEFADLEKYDAVVTVTQNDKDVLIREGLKTPVFVSMLAINTQSLPYSQSTGQLTFVGGYAHLPNKEGIDWFYSKVVPLISDEQLTLNLVGKGWPQSYGNCQGIRVCLKGFVDNLTDVAYGSIMIVPILSGSGMRMKILEAAAMSLPIVTTTVGVEGLDFRHGESCLMADTPEEFSKAIKLLCNDPKLRKTLGENANIIFNSTFHPHVLAKVRDDIYSRIVHSE